MGSFIQNNAGDFELVVLESHGLVHYLRRNVAFDSPWEYQGTITRDATGAGSLIQSTFGTTGNLELVVPEGPELVHYWRDSSIPEPKWSREAVISTETSGPASLIQNTSGDDGDFEVLIREGSTLVHYSRNKSDDKFLWSRYADITYRATARGSLVQNRDRAESAPGNFDTVVLQDTSLVHYYHDSPDYKQPWLEGATITGEATGPGSLIRSSQGDTGRLEVLVPEGNEVAHYYQQRDGWVRGGVVSFQATGGAAFIRSNLGDHGNNLEAVVKEGHQLAHYFHDPTDTGQPWSHTAFITDRL